MLAEINGVLQSGQIQPDSFQTIQQQATKLEQLQRQFGPPPILRRSTDIHHINVDTSRVKFNRTLTIKVMNRGVEDAAAVLSHHGWQFSQIRGVLKPASTPLNNLGFTLLKDFQTDTHLSYSWPKPPQRKFKFSALKTFAVLFWFGTFVFVAVSFILHLL
ncbi:MAG: hypothetical protein AAGA46_08785 [Cyanobacteria bacterium P01_F01_bin.13]